MPKAVFYGELRLGKRDRAGALRKRFKDQLKQQLSAASMPCRERLGKHCQRQEQLESESQGLFKQHDFGTSKGFEPVAFAFALQCSTS